MSEPLDEDALAEVARRLAAANRVVVLTGAGISAESGIPTFRGAAGLYRGFDPTKLATPEAFRADPETVWGFYNWRRSIVAAATPNAGHLALVELASLVPHLAIVTQNVDRLHLRAGSVNVIELHGDLDKVRCSGCGRTVDRAGETLPERPTCEVCGELERPNVVWFGENLPAVVMDRAAEEATQADVLLVVGTSAVVHPAAGLIGIARRSGAFVVEVNLAPTDASTQVDVGLYGPAGTILPRLVGAIAEARS